MLLVPFEQPSWLLRAAPDYDAAKDPGYPELINQVLMVHTHH